MIVSAALVTRGDHDLAEIFDSLPFNEVVVYDNTGTIAVLRSPGAQIETSEATYFFPHGSELYDFGTVDGPNPDLAVYGRYAAAERATSKVVFVQDDDCVLPPESIAALLAAYQPGHVVCNMPSEFRHSFYRDHALVGFGAVFDRDLPKKAFDRFAAMVPRLGLSNYGWSLPGGEGGRFNRCCDVVFTTLTPRILVDVPYRNLPWATDPDRMYRQPDHVGDRVEILDLAKKVRDHRG